MALGAQWHMLPQRQAGHLGAPLATTVIEAHMPWRLEMTACAWARWGLNMQLWLGYNI